jgi:hypothetical protein
VTTARKAVVLAVTLVAGVAIGLPGGASWDGVDGPT